VLVPAGVVIALFLGAGVITFGGPGILSDTVSGTPGQTEGPLSVQWVSNTGTSIEGNHHAVAAGRVGGQPVVLVPLGGRAGDHTHPSGEFTHDHTETTDTECALVALDGAGEEFWRATVSDDNCTIHAVADPMLADFLGDKQPEALVTSTDNKVAAYAPLTGEIQFEASLSDYGYTRPVVADLTGDGTRELLVADVRGTLVPLRPDGTTVWSRSFDAFTWGQPVIADFTADGRREVVAGFDSGQVVLLEGATGKTVWNRSVNGPVTWLTTSGTDQSARANDQPPSGATDSTPEVYVATSNGLVVGIDGASGQTEWTRQFDALTAVRAFGDGDGDGEPELYVVASDAGLRALDARTGETEWVTVLTENDVQMTPPPSMGDIDGDDALELVAPTNDGFVRIVDPTDGTILASYERSVPIYTYVTLADLSGDGTSELLVPYGDGRVVALDGT